MRSPLGILLAGLAILGVLSTWFSARQGVPIDFYQFWSVARAVRESPVENVYAPTTRPQLARAARERARQDASASRQRAAAFRAERIDAVSTPFLYTVFAALQSDDFDTDLERFRLAGALAFGLALLSLCGAAGCSGRGTLVAVCLFTWGLPAIRFDLAEGNVNAMQLGALAGSLALLRTPGGAFERSPWRPTAAGIVLALAVAFKPNLALAAALLAAAWLAWGRRRDLAFAAAGASAGAVLAFGTSSAFFGSSSAWSDWWVALRDAPTTIDLSVGQGNFGGGRLLLDASGLAPHRGAALGLLAAALGVAILPLLRGRRAGAGLAGEALARCELRVVAVGALLPMLAGELAWPHYLVLALPAAVSLLGEWSAGRPHERAMLGIAILGMASPVLLAASGLALPALQSWIYWAAVALLFAALVQRLEARSADAGTGATGDRVAVPSSSP